MEPTRAIDGTHHDAEELAAWSSIIRPTAVVLVCLKFRVRNVALTWQSRTRSGDLGPI
jgi:hypothetical protein